MAEQRSCTKPGIVSSPDLAPPPIVGSASKTMTLRPVCAMTIAAARPLGPEPTTMASGDADIAGLEDGRIAGLIDQFNPAVLQSYHSAMSASDYWYTRLVFERALALVYLVAFLCAANQFIPLLGEHGLLPVPRFVRFVPFRSSPSLFYLAPTDAAFRVAAWTGVALSVAAVAGIAESAGTVAHACVWAALWVLYLSFVNVGQIFYAFGWETLLLEAGFFTIFAGGRSTLPSMWTIWIWRWILFRVMFGAGLIKLRGDPCWTNLTCLDYHFESQPLPNALSWYFHWLPPTVHRAGVIFNHVAELAAPLAYFAPQPFAAMAGLVTIAFQLVLVASGNLSWLNWLTIVLAIPTHDDRWFAWLPIAQPALEAPAALQRGITLNVTA